MTSDSREEKQPTPVTQEKPGTEKSDRQLIEAAQFGDKKSFSVLVRRYQKRLLRFIFGLVGAFDTAEDIVQEAFIKAWQALDRFKLGQPFYPWLSTIARNLAYNLIQREQRKESLDKLTDAGYDPAQVDLGPLERLMADENKRRFYQAVMAMPTTYRAVFVLRHFEDMPYTDIASYLKIPPGTVDSRLYRARKYLLEELKDLLD